MRNPAHPPPSPGLDLPLYRKAGRDGLQEPPGSDTPRFSAPVDGKPRDRGSQVKSVWSMDVARKMHWWALDLGPAAAQARLGSPRRDGAGNGRCQPCKEPPRPLGCVCGATSLLRWNAKPSGAGSAWCSFTSVPKNVQQQMGARERSKTERVNEGSIGL